MRARLEAATAVCGSMSQQAFHEQMPKPLSAVVGSFSRDKEAFRQSLCQLVAAEGGQEPSWTMDQSSRQPRGCLGKFKEESRRARTTSLQEGDEEKGTGLVMGR